MSKYSPPLLVAIVLIVIIVVLPMVPSSVTLIHVYIPKTRYKPGEIMPVYIVNPTPYTLWHLLEYTIEKYEDHEWKIYNVIGCYCIEKITPFSTYKGFSIKIKEDMAPGLYRVKTIVIIETSQGKRKVTLSTYFQVTK